MAASDSSAPIGNPKPNIRWTTHAWFAVVFLIYVIDNADRFMVSAVLPAIKQEFALTDAQAGLMGGMLPLGICLLAIPAGILVDRANGRYVVSGMVALWSAFTALTGFATSYPMLLLARMGVGVGEAGYNPAAYAMIAAWYPKSIRATMVGIFTMGSPLGGAVGVGLAGYITFHYGWRHVFGVMAVPGLLLALLFLFSPNYRAQSSDAEGGSSAKSGLVENLRFVLANRTLLYFLLSQLVIFMYVGAANVWSTGFLMRALDINVAAASRIAVMVVIVGAIGVFSGGVMSDWLTRRYTRGRVHSVLISLALLGVFGSLYYATAGRGVAMSVVVLLACVTQFCQATIWAGLASAPLDLLPPQFRGKTMSLQPLFQGVTSFIAPPLVGALSDKWNLSAALLTTLIFSVAGCALLMWSALRSYETDLSRQESKVAAPASA